MPASTETLVNLRALTSEARGKANVTVPDEKRIFKNKYPYNVRVNKITAVSGVSFGNTYNFQLPTFGQVCGESFIEMTLPALAGTDTYRRYPLVQLVKKIVYRASTNFYEFEPAKDLPILLNRCKDPTQKAQLLALFEDSALSGSGGTYVLPLVTPWSVWHSDRLMVGPIKHHNRAGGIWDSSMLADNLVIEIQFHTVADALSDSGAAFATASNLGDVIVRWEEIVASPNVLSAIKAEIPNNFMCEEYTRLEDQVVQDDSATTYRVASLVSRAGTHGFYFRVRAATDDTTLLDPFLGDEHISSLVIRCDGREIYNSDSHPDRTRNYLKVLAGDPGDVGKPKFAHWMFGNSSRNYDAGHITGMLKNGACNELDLDIQCIGRVTDPDMLLDIVAVHLRQFTFEDRTIRDSNVY